MIPPRAYRGPGPGRPAGIPLPPGPMPLLRRGRMLKRWRYVGVFAPELMLCAGAVRIGPGRQSFWAVWDRGARSLRGRTVWRHGGVDLSPGRLRVVDHAVTVDLALDEAAAEVAEVEVVTPDAGGYAWTRKRAPVAARGRVTLDGRTRELEALALIDDSAGYHPRHTAWRWCAGVGRGRGGEALAWNLVDGVHDAAGASERTVWVDGPAREVGPVRFAAGLTGLAFAEGGELRFAAEATRARHDNLLLVRSRYEQPFGTFEGSLPGGPDLAEGFGVMERHSAVW